MGIGKVNVGAKHNLSEATEIRAMSTYSKSILR
jgi:hypothetical protein